MYSSEQLDRIYDRTSGKCHLCHKKLSRSNYGRTTGRATWEVEHSRPRVHGGTDHGSNLYAACVSCNRSKSSSSTRSMRARNGVTRAPLSKQQAAEARSRNTFLGGGITATLGGMMMGPPGFLAGAVLGALLGNSAEIE